MDIFRGTIFDLLPSKPYTAISTQINHLVNSEEYEENDLSGIPGLIEVLKLQNQKDGSLEASRAIRKKLKYGNVRQQLRALTILDALIQNAGHSFRRWFADEALLERLRVCCRGSLSPHEVKEKCHILFTQWAAAYKGVYGMEKVVYLYNQMPTRKALDAQAKSKVLQETEREAMEDPFGSVEDELVPDESSSMTPATASITPTPKYLPNKPKPDKHGKKSRARVFNLEKEKPQLLQTIASSSVASTNLMNALKLLNRESIRVSEHEETVNRFETCKGLRRQILRYIQHVESEQWLGSLISANDGLVEALMAFEILDKSVDDDSDSDEQEGSDGKEPAKSTRPESDKERNTQEAFSKLDLGKNPDQQSSRMLPKERGQVGHAEDDNSEDEKKKEEEEGDDPFSDSNAVHTPKGERPGMTW